MDEYQRVDTGPQKEKNAAREARRVILRPAPAISKLRRAERAAMDMVGISSRKKFKKWLKRQRRMKAKDRALPTKKEV